MSFAKTLKQKMDEQQMTQSELAVAIGKGKSSVSQYLSGKNIPKLDVQEKIADVLGCSVDDLNSSIPVSDQSTDSRVSIAEAARILGKSPQFVRVALQSGTAPFGFAVKTKTKYDYHISRKKLNEYIGS